MESAHTDAEGRPIITRIEDNPDKMYEDAYSMLPVRALKVDGFLTAG